MECDFVVLTDSDGGTATLTTRSLYCIPVLRVESTELNGDFAPNDRIDIGHGPVSAAEIVAEWGDAAERSDKEREVAEAYLRRWPEGPQLRWVARK